MTNEYRVRWRRASWSPSTVSVRYYQRGLLAKRFAAKLEASGEFQFVEVHRRKVGLWSDCLSRVTPMGKTAKSPPPPDPDLPASPEGTEAADEDVDVIPEKSRDIGENDGGVRAVGGVVFPNPEFESRRWW